MSILGVVTMRRRRRRAKSSSSMWLHRTWQVVILLLCTCSLSRTNTCSLASAAPRENNHVNNNHDKDNDGGESITSNCPDRCKKIHNDTTSTASSSSETKQGARILYLLIVHNQQTLDDSVHLFRSIRDEQNIILIHVDIKAQHLLMAHNDTALHHEIATCSCGSTVRMQAVHDVKWSEWSMVLPTLWGMTLGVQEYHGLWDVFVNAAGDTLPVYTPNRMAELLDALPYNFVTSSSCETGLLPTNVYLFPTWWHKRRHYTRDGTEADPVFDHILSSSSSPPHDKKNQQTTTTTTTVVTHFGSQWVILQAEFCQWIVEQMERPDSLASQLAEYLEESGKLMTDETFLPSLLMHADEFQETLPQVDEDGFLLFRNKTASQIRHVRYERMDEHYPSAFGVFPTQQRYNVPNSSTTVSKPRIWGPYFLGVYDLANIRHSGALYIRKVSMEIDPNMLRLFPVDTASQIPLIDWPNEVAISEKPRWDLMFQDDDDNEETTEPDPERDEDL